MISLNLPDNFAFLKKWGKKIKPFIGPGLLTLTLLFLPGNSYYETLDLRTESAVATEINSDLLPDLPPLPIRRLDSQPEIIAPSALLADYDSGVILYEKNIDQPLPMASLTKIMTALIILEEFPQDQILTVDNFFTEGHLVGIEPQEQFHLFDLVYALLVMSGNDVAQTLADVYPGGEVAFISRMNEKAQELGLENTHFTNPHGLDNPAHYSSARDLFRLTNYALKNEEFAAIIRQGNGQICDLTGQSCHQIETTNELLASFPGILGVKTGFTDEAGGCFVGFWEQENRRFISVVLGSFDRFEETKKLLSWGITAFSFTEVDAINPLD
jgi:D-alanyl-D-alanine carboxypeptidase